VTDTITLTLPMTPDRRLAPNRNNGRMRWTTGEWIKADRDKARFNAGHHILDSPISDPVQVAVTIYWGKSLKAGKKRARIEQDRRLDWDSATALCKPMIDGALVDTGILADDRQIVSGTVWQDVDPSGEGYTVITLTTIAGRQAA